MTRSVAIVMTAMVSMPASLSIHLASMYGFHEPLMGRHLKEMRKIVVKVKASMKAPTDQRTT